MVDKKLYLNERLQGPARWTGWFEVPGNQTTDSAPSLATFQGDLYLFVKNLGGEILVTVRSPEGSWTDWAAVPGGGMTDVPVCALRADPTGSNAGTDPSHGDTDQLHDQLYLFSKGIGDRAPYLNIASETGTWSQWQPIHSGGTTDVAFAAAPIRDKLYLFARGIGDAQIYVRRGA